MTKIISLSDNAYKELKSLKEKDESFSDVALKLVRKYRKGSLLDLFGKWPGTPEEAEQMKREIELGRKRFKTRDVTW